MQRRRFTLLLVAFCSLVAGDTAAASVIIMDETAAGQNITFSGSPAFVSSCLNEGLSVDGSLHYGNAPATAAQVLQELTVEGYIRWDGTPGVGGSVGRNVIDKFLNNNDLGRSWALIVNPVTKRLSAQVRYATGSVEVTAADPDPLPLNRCVHVAFTVDASSVRLYVDGQLKTTADFTGKNINYAINTHIGFANSDNFTAPYVGIIDEFRLSNIARTTFPSGLAPQHLPVDGHTVALWRFDQTTPSIPVTRQFFDDFSYQSDISNSKIASAFGWTFLDTLLGTPGNIRYAAQNVRCVDDPEYPLISGPRLMRLTCGNEGTVQSIVGALVCTAPIFLEGTYAARVKFSESAGLYEDGNVQAFYAYGGNEEGDAPELFSECDFEFLPYDTWGYSNGSPVLYNVSWGTDDDHGGLRAISPRAGSPFPPVGSRARWIVLRIVVAGGQVVEYFEDDAAPIVHERNTNEPVGSVSVYPERPMAISFNDWIAGGQVGEASTSREHELDVDWVYFAEGEGLSYFEVLDRVQLLRGAGRPRVNTMENALAVVYTPVGSSVDLQLGSGASVLYSTVATEGTTQLQISPSRETPFVVIPTDAPLEYDLSTTATYSGPVVVRLAYDESGASSASNLRLMHWDGSVWVDVTTSIDPIGKTISGAATSLSPFVIVDTAPVPVKLVDLRLELVGGSVRVAWTTSDEMSHLGFNIYRRAVGGSWGRLPTDLVTGGPGYEYLDRSVEHGGTYEYEVEAVARSGETERFGPVSIEVPVWSGLALRAVPNPMTTGTTLSFQLATAGWVAVRVLDLAGRSVRTLVDTDKSLGEHTVTWDALDESGRLVASGIYFVKLETRAGNRVIRLTLIP